MWVCLCARARVCVCVASFGCAYVSMAPSSGVEQSAQQKTQNWAASVRRTHLGIVTTGRVLSQLDEICTTARARVCEDESAKTKKREIRVELRQEGGVFYWQMGASRQLFCDAEFGLYSPQNVNQPPPCSPLKYAEEILKSRSKKGKRTE